MSTHDTLRVEDPQASAGHALLIAQTSDLLLQACGLCDGSSPVPCGQTEQNGPTLRGRGRPQRVCWTQLWSSLLLCALQGMNAFADWRRLLGLQAIGPFAPVWLTRTGLVKGLLQAGLVSLQELWEHVNARLAHNGALAVPAELAAFGSRHPLS